MCKPESNRRSKVVIHYYLLVFIGLQGFSSHFPLSFRNHFSGLEIIKNIPMLIRVIDIRRVKQWVKGRMSKGKPLSDRVYKIPLKIDFIIILPERFSYQHITIFGKCIKNRIFVLQ